MSEMDFTKDNDFENYISEFTMIWHEILGLHKKFEVEKIFPNFCELSTVEISIIQMVSDDENILLKDISQQLSLPKSTLTHIIDRLEKKGYLCRKISQRDLRSYGLKLTSKGQLAQNEHIKYEKFIFSGILQALDSDNEREQFICLLKKIQVNLAEMIETSI